MNRKKNQQQLSRHRETSSSAGLFFFFFLVFIPYLLASSFLCLVTINFFVWINSFCSESKTGFIFTFDSNIIPQKT